MCAAHFQCDDALCHLAQRQPARDAQSCSSTTPGTQLSAHLRLLTQPNTSASTNVQLGPLGRLLSACLPSSSSLSGSRATSLRGAAGMGGQGL